MSWKDAKMEARKMRESSQMFQDVEDDDVKNEIGGHLSIHDQRSVSLDRISGHLVGVVKDFFLVSFNQRCRVICVAYCYGNARFVPNLSVIQN